MMPELRAFIAIELPEPVRAMLERVQQTLAGGSGGQAIRWVPPAGIHLTLKFLGNIPDTQVPAIVQALEGIAEGQRRLALQTGELGSFPPQGALRVVWVGVGGETAALVKLQQRVEKALLPLGHKPEGRPFAAHLTLGRVRERALPGELRAFALALRQTAFDERLPISVAGLTLFESRLQAGGAVYHPLAHIWYDQTPKPEDLQQELRFWRRD